MTLLACGQCGGVIEAALVVFGAGCLTVITSWWDAFRIKRMRKKCGGCKVGHATTA